MKRKNYIVCLLILLLTHWQSGLAQNPPYKVVLFGDTGVFFSVPQVYKLAETVLELQACSLQVEGLAGLLDKAEGAITKRDQIISLDSSDKSFQGQLIENYYAESLQYKNQNKKLSRKIVWLKVQRFSLCVGVAAAGIFYLMK